MGFAALSVGSPRHDSDGQGSPLRGGPVLASCWVAEQVAAVSLASDVAGGARLVLVVRTPPVSGQVMWPLCIRFGL